MSEEECKLVRQAVRASSETLNQFINVAVAEKLAALRTERYFQERAARANRADFLALLEKAGTEVAIEGDELPLAEDAGGAK